MMCKRCRKEIIMSDIFSFIQSSLEAAKTIPFPRNKFYFFLQTIEEQPTFITGDPGFPIKRENGKFFNSNLPGGSFLTTDTLLLGTNSCLLCLGLIRNHKFVTLPNTENCPPIIKIVDFRNI